MFDSSIFFARLPFLILFLTVVAVLYSGLYPYQYYNQLPVTMAPLNIFSLNVQGFNTPHKRTKALRSFTATKAHIICLQETNFTEKSTLKFLSASYPQFYSSSATTKQRGTLIGFHLSTPFTFTSKITDPEGRYLVLIGHISDTTITIVSYCIRLQTSAQLLFSHLF